METANEDPMASARTSTTAETDSSRGSSSAMMATL